MTIKAGEVIEDIRWLYSQRREWDGINIGEGSTHVVHEETLQVKVDGKWRDVRVIVEALRKEPP